MDRQIVACNVIPRPKHEVGICGCKPIEQQFDPWRSHFNLRQQTRQLGSQHTLVDDL